MRKYGRFYLVTLLVRDTCFVYILVQKEKSLKSFDYLFLEGKMTRTSAAIIIIGDEILKGQIQDSNTLFLAQQLKDCGVRVQRVSFFSDFLQIF